MLMILSWQAIVGEGSRAAAPARNVAASRSSSSEPSGETPYSRPSSCQLCAGAGAHTTVRSSSSSAAQLGGRGCVPCGSQLAEPRGVGVVQALEVRRQGAGNLAEQRRGEGGGHCLWVAKRRKYKALDSRIPDPTVDDGGVAARTPDPC